MEEGWGTFRILTGKTKGKRPLGRPWRRWEDNIIVVLEKIRGIEFICLKIGITGEPYRKRY